MCVSFLGVCGAKFRELKNKGTMRRIPVPVFWSGFVSNERGGFLRFKAQAKVSHRATEKALPHFTTTSHTWLEHGRWRWGRKVAVAESWGFQCSSRNTCDSQVNGRIMKCDSGRHPMKWIAISKYVKTVLISSFIYLLFYHFIFSLCNIIHTVPYFLI